MAKGITGGAPATKSGIVRSWGMSDTPNPRYDQAKRSVQTLGPADQLRLIAELVGRLSGELDRQPRRSLLELQGLGKGEWKAIDVDEYLRRERSSCDG